MVTIRGIAASLGIAIGKTFVVLRGDDTPVALNTSADSVEKEANRFHEARQRAREVIVGYAAKNELLVSHIDIIDDEMLIDGVISKLSAGNQDALSALEQTCSEITALFVDIDDEYLRSRADDIIDVCSHIKEELRGRSVSPFAEIPDGSIVVADNLMPSDMALIDLDKVAGIALEHGGTTSHACIIARNRALPAAIGFGKALQSISGGVTAVLDGEAGLLVIDPDEETLSRAIEKQSRKDDLMRNFKIETGGIEVSVLANAGSVSDVRRAIECGAAGIGLLRTEFIFMQADSFPGEGEQFRIYSECAKICGEKPLVIRTLDIGADKRLPYFQIRKEDNPLMGLRGIRFSLSYPEIFKTQLRAVLRAAATGNVRLMFPMITTINEFDEACRLLDECKSELRIEGMDFDENLCVGMMIETPASIMMSDIFAEKAAFFSIGTNDLVQYLFAIDRDDPYKGYMAEVFPEALERSIARVVSSAQKYGIEVSVCGELASNQAAIGHLLRLGVRKFSVNSCI